jgi:energy-coupling factor transporter transmembrane protein EcfT
MKINNRILLFFVLPTLAPLILPPKILLGGIGAVLVVAALLLASGYFLSRGKPLALTFTIFLQGLNFVVRMMLFFSTSISSKGVADWTFAITSLLSMALSFYLLFRLDQVDIRAQLKA